MRRFSYRDTGSEGGIATGVLVGDDTVRSPDGSTRARQDLTPAPAVARPGKVICVGLNYKDHCD